MPDQQGQGAHPIGTVRPQSVASCCSTDGSRSQATLWMPQWKVLSVLQAAAQSSPAVSVQHPTGPGYPEAFVPQPHTPPKRGDCDGFAPLPEFIQGSSEVRFSAGHSSPVSLPLT